MGPGPNYLSNVPVKRRIGHYVTNAVYSGVIRLAFDCALRRVGFRGWIVQRVIGPVGVDIGPRALKKPKP